MAVATAKHDPEPRRENLHRWIRQLDGALARLQTRRTPGATRERLRLQARRDHLAAALVDLSQPNANPRNASP